MYNNPDVSFTNVDFKIEKRLKKNSAILTLIHMVILLSNIFSKPLMWVGSEERNVIRKTWFYVISKLDGSLKIT